METRNTLTDDEREEYAEILENCRHDDTVIYQLGAILLPLALGAVAVAAQFPGLRYPLAVFSLLLYLYWFLVSVRYSWFSEVRRIRGRELESKAGLNHLQIFLTLPPEMASQLGARLSIRRLRILFLVFLTVTWSVLLIWLR